MALLLKEGNGGRPGGANGWSMINTQGTTTFCSFFGPGHVGPWHNFGTWIAWTVNPSPTLGKSCPGTAAPEALKNLFLAVMMLGSGSAESASMWEAAGHGDGGCGVCSGCGGLARRWGVEGFDVKSNGAVTHADRLATYSRLRPWQNRSSIEGPAFARRANARRSELTSGHAS